LTKIAIHTRRALALLLFFAVAISLFAQEAKSGAWRVATDAELKGLIPARAPVVQERIETELRTASALRMAEANTSQALF